MLKKMRHPTIKQKLFVNNIYYNSVTWFSLCTFPFVLVGGYGSQPNRTVLLCHASNCLSNQRDYVQTCFVVANGPN